jgi:hypothetical protein
MICVHWPSIDLPKLHPTPLTLSLSKGKRRGSDNACPEPVEGLSLNGYFKRKEAESTA